MRENALSISPILVIDDNPFYEGLYKELKTTMQHTKQSKVAREKN